MPGTGAWVTAAFLGARRLWASACRSPAACGGGTDATPAAAAVGCTSSTAVAAAVAGPAVAWLAPLLPCR